MSTMKELLAQRNARARRVVLQSAVLKELKARHDEDRAELQADMERGEKITARTDDQSLGTVSYSDPKPKARVTDRAALLGHVAEDAPGRIGLRITDMPRALALLEADYPELVEPALSSQDEAHYLRAAEKGESIPGVEVATGAPVMSVRPSQAGKDAATELVAGNRALTAQAELEAGDE
ncbi:hypothetical protein [Corynebacterium kalidii]|uniref:Uncharacterized protein n=1 Tax=Corynebacterium kalidii TaxID=2931982 RepID=A0A9X1WIL0_9CORY|nr:hypothetical protein [Corynebacterium kalidii]MCJ7859236.1 hypothetical protein [Corynebacterium kalidii]